MWIWFHVSKKVRHYLLWSLWIKVTGTEQQNWRQQQSRAEKVEQQVLVRPGTRMQLTEEDDDTEQYGHQGSSGEAIWEGQDLGIAWLHVATAVAGTDAHNEGAGAALDGVVVVWDHHRQEIHAHLSAAEASSSCQDVGSVVCGVSQKINKM